jgi:hypothetical protein
LQLPSILSLRLGKRALHFPLLSQQPLHFGMRERTHALRGVRINAVTTAADFGDRWRGCLPGGSRGLDPVVADSQGVTIL